jgi:hypothetical protein
MGGAYGRVNAAYESGRVIAVNTDGLLRAFDAGSGTPLWSRQLSPSYSFSSAPTVHGGVVYTLGAGDGGFLYAVRASDGEPLWSAEAGSGGQCTPAVTDEGVYVSSAGPEVFKLHPQTGQRIWRYYTGRSGGGGRTPVYAGGRLYVRDHGTSPLILDASTGALLRGKLPDGPAPAVEGGRYYFRSMDGDGAGRLTAYDVDTHQVVWSRSLDVVYTSAPIVVNGDVFLGVGDEIRAYDGETGALLWDDELPAAVWPPDEDNVMHALTGLGAGEETVLVPAGRYLAAYGTGTLITHAQLSGDEGENDWFLGPVQVTLVPRRGNSPAAATTYYQLDGGRVILYAGPFTVTGEAIHRLTFWSVDAAGQKEPKQTIPVKIDPTAPSPRLRTIPARLNGSRREVRHVCLHLRGKSVAAGIDPDSLEYEVEDEYGQYQLTGTLHPRKDGAYIADVYLASWHERSDRDGRQYTITVTGTDLAGNEFTAEATVNGR